MKRTPCATNSSFALFQRTTRHHRFRFAPGCLISTLFLLADSYLMNFKNGLMTFFQFHLTESVEVPRQTLLCQLCTDMWRASFKCQCTSKSEWWRQAFDKQIISNNHIVVIVSRYRMASEYVSFKSDVECKVKWLMEQMFMWYVVDIQKHWRVFSRESYCVSTQKYDILHIIHKIWLKYC